MRKILCAMDLSQRSELAVQRAALLAERIEAELLLLHVVDDGKDVRTIRRRSNRAKAVLEWRARDLEKTGCQVQVSVIVGKRHRAIARFAGEWGADLIILGGYRSRFSDALLGTTAERVMRQAQRAVLVVNAVPTGHYADVLMATDLSEAFTRVVRLTEDLGVLDGARVSVVHAFEPAVNALPYAAATTEPHAGQYLESMRRSTDDTLAAQFGAAGLDMSQFSIFKRDAAPLRAIDDVAQRIESDLVVVGASRFPALKRTLVGSVSSEVVRNLQCDVLVVPPGALPRANLVPLAEDLLPPAC
jgi:nucleotide-binding universal stress UspA family protein